MDRNEIALRFAVAYLTTPHAPHVIPPWQEPHDVVAREAFNRADAFLAASQPAPAASEAPRPEWVRVVSKNGWETTPFTIGKVYRVERWSKAGRPEVMNDEGGCWELSLRGDKPDDKFSTFASWVPAEPPRSVGRAALAAKIRLAYTGFDDWPDALDAVRDDWLRAADAAIAFITNGGAL